jgi:hypothetical protein
VTADRALAAVRREAVWIEPTAVGLYARVDAAGDARTVHWSRSSGM